MQAVQRAPPPALDAPLYTHASHLFLRTESDPAQRFAHALSDVLPELTDARIEPARKILAAYILYALYSGDAQRRALNPFNGALGEAFLRERRRLLELGDRAPSGHAQLVWVLWRIATGNGDDLAIFSPTTLSSSPLPTSIRPTKLQLASEANNEEELVSLTHSSSFADPDDSFVAPRAAQQGSAGIIGRSSREKAGPASAIGDRRVGSVGISTASTQGTGATQRSLPAVDVDPAQVASVGRALEFLSASCTRVLSLSEQRIVKPHLAEMSVTPGILKPSDFVGLVLHNASLGAEYASLALRGPGATPLSTKAHFTDDDYGPDIQPLLDAVTTLPPTLHAFEFWGRLLRDENVLPEGDASTNGLGIAGPSSNGASSKQATTVSDFIRATMLGTFLSNCIRHVEIAESEMARHVAGADDRVARGVSGLCRFYGNLVKLRLIDTSSDEQTAEMTAFALAHSSFDDARKLYRELLESKQGDA